MDSKTLGKILYGKVQAAISDYKHDFESDHALGILVTINAGANLNLAPNPLMLALNAGRDDIVLALINQPGIDLEQSIYATAHSLAVSKRFYDLANLMLDKIINPLLFACKRGLPINVKMLSEASDVNLKAIWNSEEHIFKLLEVALYTKHAMGSSTVYAFEERMYET